MKKRNGIGIGAIVCIVGATALGWLPARATTAQTLTYPLPDTGQVNFYSDLYQIEAPQAGEDFFGQDAQYLRNPPSFTVNADGLTVTDNVTGLTWVKTPDTDGDGDLDSDDKLTFAEFLAYPDILNALNHGGHSDWRAPTIKELYSLIDFGGVDPSGPAGQGSDPFIDTDYFDFVYGDESAGERIIDAQYWSATEYLGATMGGAATVFGVNFADGRIKGYPKTMGRGDANRQFARFVRGGEGYGANAFADNGDGTITDGATGLMWSRDDSGAGLDWREALAWVRQKNAEAYLGHGDWRLPNAKELQSIVDYSRAPDATGSAAIAPVFNATSIVNEAGQTDWPAYWTGTTHVNGSNAPGGFGAYVCFGRAMGYWQEEWTDAHGAGAQRSDPKEGDPDDWPTGHGPQGDAIRIYNHVRLVRDAEGLNPTPTQTVTESPSPVPSPTFFPSPTGSPTPTGPPVPPPPPTGTPTATPNPSGPPAPPSPTPTPTMTPRPLAEFYLIVYRPDGRTPGEIGLDYEVGDGVTILTAGDRATLRIRRQRDVRNVDEAELPVIPYVNNDLGGFRRVETEAPIGRLRCAGTLETLLARDCHVADVVTSGVGRIAMRSSLEGGAFTRIVADVPDGGAPGRPALVRLSGVALVGLRAPGQEFRRISLASRRVGRRGDFAIARGGIVAREAPAPDTPTSGPLLIEPDIVAASIRCLDATGCDIAPAAIVAGLEKVRLRGRRFGMGGGERVYLPANFRPRVLHSLADGLDVMVRGGDVAAEVLMADGRIERLAAKADRASSGTVGGRIGLPPIDDDTTTMIVAAGVDEATTGDIGLVYGSDGVAGVFFAGATLDFGAEPPLTPDYGGWLKRLIVRGGEAVGQIHMAEDPTGRFPRHREDGWLMEVVTGPAAP